MNGRPKRCEVKYEPTGVEIREACSRIQASWSRRERLRRSGEVKADRVTAPIVKTEGLHAALQDLRSK